MMCERLSAKGTISVPHLPSSFFPHFSHNLDWRGWGWFGGDSFNFDLISVEGSILNQKTGDFNVFSLETRENLNVYLSNLFGLVV
jgi:hypothetical protein